MRALLWLVGLGPWVVPARGENVLRHVEQYVATRFPSLRQIEPSELAARISAEDGAPVLFDTRARDEFDAGHLSGALYLDPSIDGREFERRHSALIAGRDVVVYCAVGLRSARLARRLGAVMSSVGATDIANLRGGIFRWHNEQRPIERGDGRAGRLHPYNRFWSRFVVRIR